MCTPATTWSTSAAVRAKPPAKPARAAGNGGALGVDVSAPMLERARRLAEAEGLRNVTFQHGDAQSHRFSYARFDLCISRFGTMFFTDPIAAFANIGRAMRAGARLVLLVWQDADRNEWFTAVRQALAGSTPPTPTDSDSDTEPFSSPTPRTRSASSPPPASPMSASPQCTNPSTTARTPTRPTTRCSA